MGARYRRIFKGLQFEDEANRSDYARVVMMLDEHFEPKKLTKLYMRRFDACKQRLGETVGEFISNLWEIAQDLPWEYFRHQLCKQISSGVRSRALRDSLCSKDLPFEQLIQRCHLYEQKQTSLDVIDGAGDRPTDRPTTTTGDVHFAGH